MASAEPEKFVELEHAVLPFRDIAGALLTLANPPIPKGATVTVTSARAETRTDLSSPTMIEVRYDVSLENSRPRRYTTRLSVNDITRMSHMY